MKNMNRNYTKFISYIILLIATNSLFAQTPKLIPYREGAMYGYCNEAKKIIIPLLQRPNKKNQQKPLPY